MRNIRIGARLSIVFIVYLVMILVQGIVSYYHNQQIHITQKKLHYHPFSVSQSLHTINHDITDIRHKYWMIHNEPTAARSHERKEIIIALHDDILKNFENVSKRYLGEKEDVATARKKYKTWKDSWGKWIEQSHTSENISDYGTLERHDYLKLLSNISFLLDFAAHKAQEYSEISNNLQHSFTRSELILLGVFILLSILFSYLVLNSINKPINQIKKIVMQIREGDLSARCEERYKDEFSQLGGVINEMTAQLLESNRDLENKVEERTHELEEEIQERIKSQKEVERNEKMFRSLFESNLFGAAFWDKNGKLIKVNDKFLQILNYTRVEYEVKEIFWQDISPDSENYPGFQEAIAPNPLSDDNTVEKELVSKEGKRIPVLLGGERINTDPLTWITFILDISQKRESEKKLAYYQDHLEMKIEERTKKLKDNMNLLEESREALTYLVEDANDSRNELLEVNKQLDALNKELEAFSYSVSHDLKSPLRAIDGFSLALVEDYHDALDDEGKELIQLVRNNAQKMGSLIQDLLEFSRLGRKDIKYTSINMTELVNDVYGECLVLEKNRKINFYCGQLPVVYGDRAMIHQVIVNLLSNAMKFSRNKEEAKISVDIVSQANEKLIEFIVKDNGVGFNMAYYDKLFGVFQRLHSDEVFEGTGVGLALIKRIITKHKGTIWAESEPDKGAEFHFTIPVRKYGANVLYETDNTDPVTDKKGEKDGL